MQTGRISNVVLPFLLPVNLHVRGFMDISL